MLSDAFSAIRLTCVIAASRARDAITCTALCNYGACSCGNYSSLLNYEGWDGGEKYSSEELRLFLGSGIITYTHLPEIVDRKYALSAEITTFPRCSLPLLSAPTVWRKTKAPQWEISINQANQQERRPPISPGVFLFPPADTNAS